MNTMNYAFSINKLYFGIECIRKMGNVPFIELLLYPDEYLQAIRAAPSGNRNAVKWTVLKGTDYQPRNISGAAFLKTAFDIFGWRTECKYRVRGIRKQNASDSICLLDMREIEVFIPSDQVTPYDESLPGYPKNIACFDIMSITSTPKTVCVYPADWVSFFGSDYYRHRE